MRDIMMLTTARALIVASFIALGLAQPLVPQPAAADEFGSLLKGRIIDVTDGFLTAKVTLNAENMAHAVYANGAREADGMWWPRPDGRLCLTFEALWEGGDCGFIRKNGTSYALTLAPWNPPGEWNLARTTPKRETFPAPATDPGLQELKRADLIGHTLLVEGAYSTVNVFFKDDATFDYRADDGLAFTGHWFVRDDGTFCLVSRKLWRIGYCFEAHGATGRIDWAVTDNSYRNWFRAELRSGPTTDLKLR